MRDAATVKAEMARLQAKIAQNRQRIAELRPLREGDLNVMITQHGDRLGHELQRIADLTRPLKPLMKETVSLVAMVSMMAWLLGETDSAPSEGLIDEN